MDNADKAGDKREKSLTFGVQHRARGTKEPQSVELNGEQPPQRHEFRQLGMRVRMHPKRGTSPLLTKRVQEAQTALKKSRSLPLGFDIRVAIAAVMIIAAALYGVRLADISKKTAASLESTVMYALWGPDDHVGQRKSSLLFSCRDTARRRRWSSGTGQATTPPTAGTLVCRILAELGPGGLSPSVPVRPPWMIVCGVPLVRACRANQHIGGRTRGRMPRST